MEVRVNNNIQKHEREEEKERVFGSSTPSLLTIFALQLLIASHKQFKGFPF